MPMRGTDSRTGRDFDHVAFLPDPLGDPPRLGQQAWSAVVQASHALGRLSQAAQLIPNPERLRQPTLNREAQSTSALEGTYAPLNEVMASDAADRDSEFSSALREVRNFVRCARRAFDWISSGRPLTVALILELHAILVRGTPSETEDAGRIRTVPVVIGNRAAPIEEARFIPPPPGIDLEASLADLVRWINTPEPARDAVVSSAMAHYQFETLHPFNDGTGRIGRLLVVVHLMISGALSDSLLSISPWFEARRSSYQDHLAEVSATGDWDSWIEFFASGLAASATDTVERAAELFDLQQSYQQQVRQGGGRGLILDIAELLIGSPYVSVRQLCELTGKTFPAVNTAVKRLVDLGILREVTGRSYGRIYRASEAMRIYSRPASAKTQSQRGPQRPVAADDGAQDQLF